MDGTQHHPILNFLRRVLGTPPPGGVSDADLLRRFVADRDEAAFELLLWRHAAMVLHVCGQVLRDRQAAEDAFQATFLVFVRKAASVRRRESLGGWLYKVAYHVALKARAQLKKRAPLDAELDRIESPAETDEVDRRELRRLICEEVNRLPPRYRAPIVACYFEGKTHEQAASQLGWPRGTVAGRLARARDLLRRRLMRRGVALSGATFAAALPAPAVQAATPGLIDSTIQAAKRFAAGPAAGSAGSPRSAALAEGVLKTMYWTRVKIVAVVLLLLAGLGGAAMAFWSTQKRETEPPSASASGGNAPAPGATATEPTGAAKRARDLALSRLNLRKLAAAMHRYAAANQNCLPAPAIYGKGGKALLSWRVELLPYLGAQELYNQFKRNEPWDSRHNKKLLHKMPQVYAPPGVKTGQPFLTYYQVFVGDAPAGQGSQGGASGSMAGGGAGAGGGGAATEAMGGGITPFSRGGVRQRIPVDISDGTANTILITEAGKPVPWTRPEDLPYAAGRPLPRLGGLFPDVFHAAFADGEVHTLTKQYDQKHLRYAITSNGGEVMEWEKIEAPPPRGAAAPAAAKVGALARLRHTNEALRRELERARAQIRQLNEERDVQREQSGQGKPHPPHDAQSRQLLREQAHLREGLRKARIEVEALKAEIRRLQQPANKAVERKGP
jgi:RNA polymerase sigma factor (sigma-70 family)